MNETTPGRNYFCAAAAAAVGAYFFAVGAHLLPIPAVLPTCMALRGWSFA